MSAKDELLQLIDNLQTAEDKITIIATSNKPDQVDSKILQKGRLEKALVFDVPSIDARKEILKKCLQSRKHSLANHQVETLATTAPKFTGLDLQSACNKADINMLLRNSDVLFTPTRAVLHYEDLHQSLNETKLHVTEIFNFKIPKVYWHDIGGMENVKSELMDIMNGLRHPEEYKSRGIPVTHGLLLFGPPGCSKTMIAQAFATESQFSFVSVKGPELLCQYVGESEKNVSDLFKKARSVAPCIVFFDEIDSIAPNRGSSSSGSNVESRILSQLLTEMDGIHVMTDVIVIAATNRPEFIDSALLRAGRFDRVLYVPLPDACSRKAILQIKLNKMPTTNDIDVLRLVDLTNGFSGAEIIAVLEEAAKKVIYENVTSTDSVVTMQHLLETITNFAPRTSEQQIENYKKFLKARIK